MSDPGQTLEGDEPTVEAEEIADLEPTESQGDDIRGGRCVRVGPETINNPTRNTA